MKSFGDSIRVLLRGMVSDHATLNFWPWAQTIDHLAFVFIMLAAGSLTTIYSKILLEDTDS